MKKKTLFIVSVVAALVFSGCMALSLQQINQLEKKVETYTTTNPHQ